MFLKLSMVVSLSEIICPVTYVLFPSFYFSLSLPCLHIWERAFTACLLVLLSVSSHAEGRHDIDTLARYYSILKILFLSKRYTSRGALTYNPEIESHKLY